MNKERLAKTLRVTERRTTSLKGEKRCSVRRQLGTPADAPRRLSRRKSDLSNANLPLRNGHDRKRAKGIKRKRQSPRRLYRLTPLGRRVVEQLRRSRESSANHGFREGGLNRDSDDLG
jgi:hypothetical protein